MFNLLKRRKEPAYPHIPEPLLNILKTEFEEHFRVDELFKEFFQAETYRRSFTSKLVHVARGKGGDSWKVRRLATSMLQHHVCLLPPDNIEEFDFLFIQLKLKATGANNVKDAVLKEGYSTTDLRGFIVEFRRKLERLNRVHRQIKGSTTSVEGLGDFMHLSRQDCKLPLARYLFTPQEVVDQLLKHFNVSTGKRPTRSHAKKIDEATAHLPEFEASIISRLCKDARIYWVSETTSSSLNALVEYPLTSVVLVVKPPGSTVELEIKRAGRRLHPLSVVFMRNGRAVPPYHRLDGGSKDRNLEWEAEASSLFSRIFSRVHGREAPIGTIISIASTKTIPVGKGEVPLFDYFNDAQRFGAGFDEMRKAMKQSVEASRKERDRAPSQHRDAAGLTKEFLDIVAPAQAILLGTSSFRLDGLAAYLSDEGPAQYFKEGLGVDYTTLDARRLADDVLEEVLGVYLPPDVRYQNQEHYVAAAYAVPENRARADQTYRSLMRQIGVCWGTLLGMRGYSWGESFVARNVGLRSVWEAGHWTVKIIFMDHDNLRIKKKESKDFRPKKTLRGMRYDERFILGRPEDEPAEKGAVYYLENIYQVGEDVKAKAMAAFKEALKNAYLSTQDKLIHDADLQKRFHKTFIHRLRDWNIIVNHYLRAHDDPAAWESWKEDVRALLGDKGYEQDLIKEHLETIDKNADLLTRYSFLYV